MSEIVPNRYFFEEVSSLYDTLNRFTSKEDLFDACVKERFECILSLQTSLFDEELAHFDKAISFQFATVDDIKRLANALKQLYKVITHDRMCIIKHLISIYR